jgi:hypothetical protein
MSYDFEYYSGKDLVYPTKPSVPFLRTNPSAADARIYADELEAYEVAMLEFHAEISRVGKLRNERLDEFINVLRSDFGMTQPEFDVIWGKAYDEAHNGGLAETYHKFCDLAEFVSEYNKVMMMKG